MSLECMNDPTNLFPVEPVALSFVCNTKGIGMNTRNTKRRVRSILEMHLLQKILFEKHLEKHLVSVREASAEFYIAKRLISPIVTDADRLFSAVRF